MVKQTKYTGKLQTKPTSTSTSTSTVSNTSPQAKVNFTINNNSVNTSTKKTKKLSSPSTTINTDLPILPKRIRFPTDLYTLQPFHPTHPPNESLFPLRKKDKTN